MREIGVRELKASLSQTLRAVARGEHVRVTVRGHAVADIVPAGAPSADGPLRDLIAQGRVVPAAPDAAPPGPPRAEGRRRPPPPQGRVAPAPRARPPRPPRLTKGRSSASAVVVAERDAEH